MTLIAERPRAVDYPIHLAHGPSGIVKWITSTDHKVIGKSYPISSFVFFCMACLMAVVMRTQLASPDDTV
jgi:cytochrome c oxidase subunit 1